MVVLTGQESQAFLDYLPVLSHVAVKMRSCSPTHLHLDAMASCPMALYFLVLLVAPADTSSLSFPSPPAFHRHVPQAVHLQCAVPRVLTLLILCWSQAWVEPLYVRLSNSRVQGGEAFYHFALTRRLLCLS